jgi:hypothetical protein
MIQLEICQVGNDVTVSVTYQPNLTKLSVSIREFY